MKTVEILLVIVLTTMFMLIIVPSKSSQFQHENIDYLVNLEGYEEFRDFVSSTTGCFNNVSIVDNYVPDIYEYEFCINGYPSVLPEKKVYLDSLFFAGNITSLNYKIVKLYYWSTQ